jgi:hypothetical protein
MNEVSGQGEQDLTLLLANLNPVLDAQRYVFCTTTESTLLVPEAIATFREDEGLTLVLEVAQARANGFNVGAVFRRITLTVHSSLSAVGLTAAVSRALTQQHVCANIIAAFYHDHVFVAEADAQRALKILKDIATTA